MKVKDGFTRKETIALTGASSNRLQYLERKGLICPYREHSEGKSSTTVIYTWEQILEIKAILKLVNATSFQTVRKVFAFFKDYLNDNALRDKQIVVVNDEVYWIQYDSWIDLGQKLFALKIADKKNKGVGQYTLIVVPALIEIVEDIWIAAEKSNKVDIESFKLRAKNLSNFEERKQCQI